MNFVQTILSAAKSVKVSGAILVAICTHESRLTNMVNIQDHGSPSYGICQVKHDTAIMLGYEGEPEGLMDPKTNAKYAAIYLKRQYDRYQNWCKAIAAYNAGRYNESQRMPGYPKNLKYVLNVGKNLNNHFQKMIQCDIVSTGEIDVAENHGIGLRIQSTQP